MRKKERIAHPCPKCHAKAGDECRDPLGDIMPRCHATRGPGALEAHKAKEAGRINARAVASYGPLFADLAAAEVRPVTAAELIDRDRRAAALAFDATGGPSGLALLRQCNKGLEWLWVHHVARGLAQLAGPIGAELVMRAAATYPLDYLRHILRDYFTTTKPQRIGPHRVPADNPLGFTIAYRLVWAPAAPLMTAEAFARAFPGPDHWCDSQDEPEPDDGGLFERTIGALRRTAA